MEGWIPPWDPYRVNYGLGMILAWKTLRFSLRREVYAEHLQWDSMCKGQIVWDNIFGSEVVVTGDMIYVRYGRRLTATELLIQNLL